MSSNEEWDKGVDLERENEAMENLYEALWFMGQGTDLDTTSYASIFDDIERMKRYVLKWQTYHGFKKK